MFHFKSDSGEKRDKSLINCVDEEVGEQNSLSSEEKEQKMSPSLIAVSGIALMVVVFATIGFVAMWRERHDK